MIQQYNYWIVVSSKEMKSVQETPNPTFIVALFSKAKKWKQIKCPLNDEWIKKMWYKSSMEYYPIINTNPAIVTVSMALEIIT